MGHNSLMPANRLLQPDRDQTRSIASLLRRAPIHDRAALPLTATANRARLRHASTASNAIKFRPRPASRITANWTDIERPRSVDVVRSIPPLRGQTATQRDAHKCHPCGQVRRAYRSRQCGPCPSQECGLPSARSPGDVRSRALCG
jgi:hypothetical protein